MKRILTLLAALAALPFAAQAQSDLTFRTFTSVPTVVNTGSRTNFTSGAQPLWQGRDYGLIFTMVATNAATSNIVFSAQFGVSAPGDSANIVWLTNPTATFYQPLTGTTQVDYHTNVASTVFPNMNWIRFTSITNAADGQMQSVKIRGVTLKPLAY